MKIYNKYIDQAVRTIDSVQPTFGQDKTNEFKKKLKIKKLEKELGKKPSGRVSRKGGGGLGAQSVKYALDDNYGITAADPKAKFIAAAKNKNKKKKKKVI